MPTPEQLREAFPVVSEMADDRLLQSPWLHIGILRSAVSDDSRLRLSLDVIADALRDAELQAVAR